LCALVFLLLLPLKDTRPGSIQAQYDRARRLFDRGYLEKSQQEAEAGYRQFQASNPEWAAKFRLLEAENMLFRGMYPDALALLAAYHPGSSNPEATIRALAIEAVALARQQQEPEAHRKLAQADDLCRPADLAVCAEVLRAHGILAAQEDKLPEARQFFLDMLALSQKRQDRLLEASAASNLGWLAIQLGHFDETLDWSKAAYQAAVELGAEDLALRSSGNMGWAYLQLGDRERAMELFTNAEKSAERLGSIRDEIFWVTAEGYVYRDSGDGNRATQSYRQALFLAKELGSKDDRVNALEDLAQVSVDSGKLDEARDYIAQVTPLELAGGGHLTANVVLTQGMLAAARRKDERAEPLLRAVRDDANNPTTTRLGAGEQLALLYESEGNQRAAEQTYKATLNAFDSAQAELKSEESKLPFVANASRIYDDYIHLLLTQGRSDEALAAADRSRARTLSQGLGAASGKASAAKLNPQLIARKTGATLLFYWLGEKQSCLWAITPAKIAFFPLPAQAEIATRVARYRKAVLDVEDPLESGNQDGQALYKLLVAPAAKFIRAGAPVMILADGELNQLNFETLLVPGPSPERDRNSNHRQDLHYWIDDATLVSAPSLAMLEAAKPAQSAARSLLLLGNPISPSEDFPSLPLFGFEMKNIEKHFDPQSVSAFSSRQATPAAYLSSNPSHFSYIHFVSHAVSSSTAPLDSAIILSRADTSADSYKLYARDIMRHPIDARLVTISACFGSGTRSYAGEGLVGLSWAFLRAGAHSVIGSLWEVSDDSTPRLMDGLYQGLEDGQTPADSLRQAKLALLHSNSRFQSPFYWAPFQIYSSR
jgi:CHAT domain-containing protein/tetratricopeptide (TPR) repeat protein